MDKHVANYYKIVEENIKKSIKGNIQKGKALPVGTIRDWGGKLYQKDNTNNWNFIGYANKNKKEDEKSEELKKALRGVEGNIKKNSQESLYALDDNGNISLELGGNENSVEIPDKDMPKLKDKVVTHNHPGKINKPDFAYNTVSFSMQDLNLACKTNIKEFRAVGPDDYVFVIKKGNFDKWGTDEGAKKIRETHEEEHFKVRESFENDIHEKMNKYGADDERTQEAIKYAQTNDPHETIKRVAKKLGLEYKIYKPEEKNQSYEN